MRTFVLAVAAVVLVSSSTAFAQRGMGRFAGVVVDESGSPVEGAKVTARLDGATVEGTSDDKGAWAVAGVGKGVWMVEFRKPGFTPRAAKVILERELDKVPAIKMELKKG